MSTPSQGFFRPKFFLKENRYFILVTVKGPEFQVFRLRSSPTSEHGSGVRSSVYLFDFTRLVRWFEDTLPHTHVHTHTHTYMYTYTRLHHTRTCTHVYVTNVHTHVDTHMTHQPTHEHTRTYTHTCTHTTHKSPPRRDGGSVSSTV